MGPYSMTRLRFLATKSLAVTLEPDEQRQLAELILQWESAEEIRANEILRQRCGAFLTPYDEPAFPHSDAAW